MNQERRHTPVLLKEVVEALDPGRHQGKESWWLDGTVGLGGHARAILEAAGEGAHLVGLDRDREALALAAAALRPFGTRVHLLHAPYAQAVDAAAAILPPGRGLDGALLDLGVSSLQLDSPERGFSFLREGPLDMRMDSSQGVNAAQWLAAADEDDLAVALKEFGEERHAKRMAKEVMRARDEGKLLTTHDLAAVAEKVLGHPRHGVTHPATRLFQALRLAVNEELDQLDKGLPALCSLLMPAGRMGVISFHSLEDRRVKHYFQRESADCVCPPGLPECRCGHLASLKILLKGGVAPGFEETESNPRSRSARLRAVEKI